ncbi:MAG: DNA/RNA non-specific endonuclease [Myxococcales bacterium]|nr:DNA/RNA non-specific endonuclease [Myxococcales bacterium]
MTDFTTVHPSSQHLAYLLDLYCFQGRPLNGDKDNPVVVLVNHGFAVGFCPKRMQPTWAAYRVAHAKAAVDYDRPHLYYDDARLDEALRVGSETFGDGYHVGHMVPNQAINEQFGRLAQMETFLMSNMSPQRGTLNTGVWAKLEDAIRKIEDTPDKDHVWAIAGPIFGDDPEIIERPNGSQVPLPEAYFYVMADPFRYPWNRMSNVDVFAFRIPQDAPKNKSPDDYLVDDIEEIERATKLSFFPKWYAADDGGLQPAGAGDGEPPFASRRDRHRLMRALDDR